MASLINKFTVLYSLRLSSRSYSFLEEACDVSWDDSEIGRKFVGGKQVARANTAWKCLRSRDGSCKANTYTCLISALKNSSCFSHSHTCTLTHPHTYTLPPHIPGDEHLKLCFSSRSSSSFLFFVPFYISFCYL